MELPFSWNLVWPERLPKFSRHREQCGLQPGSRMGSDTTKRNQIRPARIALFATALALTGCGEGGDTTTIINTTVGTTGGEPISTKPQPVNSPELGDACTAETPLTSLVEVDTKHGEVSCKEARGVLQVYYQNVRNEGEGHSAVLTVSGWECALAPLGLSPLEGKCTDRHADRKFEMVRVGWAQRPGNQNVHCDYPPPDGAGITEVRATNLDCEAATTMASQYEAGQCTDIGVEPGQACELEYGFTCSSRPTGYESSELTCRNKNQSAILDTGA